MNVTNYRDIDESLRRNRQGPKRALIIALLITMFTCGGVAMAQKPLVLPLETAAKSALSGDPSAIRVLTDTVISELPLSFHSSLNMNDRFFQAELQCRQHRRSGVTEGHLVLALNQLVDDLNLPAYVKTNVSQVHTYRMLGVSLYPALFGPLPHSPGQPSDLSLSPSAASYLILHLLSLKLTEPSYQTDPDTWVRETIALRRAAASKPPSRSIISSSATSPPAPSLHYEAIASGLANNSGPAARAVLLMLISFGI